MRPPSYFFSHFSAYGLLVEPPSVHCPRPLRAPHAAWREQLGRRLVAIGLRLMTPATLAR